MDLFGDLPEPSSEKEASVQNSVPEVPNPYTPEVSLKRPSEEEHSKQCPKKQATDLYRLRGYHAESRGERDDMQDAYTILDDYLPDLCANEPSLSRLAFYGVFDGHGGARASTHTSEHLHKILAKKLPPGDMKKLESEMKKCLVESFKKTDEEFLAAATKVKPAWKDGSTAVTVVAINNTLYIANLGDSKAILCRYNETTQKYSAIPLTKDHSPEQYDERMRIQKAGGYVRDGRVMGVLEVSRSIGDGPYKKHGVVCLPDVRRCQLTSQDRFVLIACDGLWKTMTPDAAIEYTNKLLKETVVEATENRSEEDLLWDTVCVGLVGEAVRRLSADNVTVVLVSINADQAMTQMQDTQQQPQASVASSQQQHGTEAQMDNNENCSDGISNSKSNKTDR